MTDNKKKHLKKTFLCSLQICLFFALPELSLDCILYSKIMKALIIM